MKTITESMAKARIAMSAPDPRYDIVKTFIQQKKITTFDEIFKYIPKSIIATDMGTNNNRMSGLIQRPWELTFVEADFLATVFDIKFKVLSAMIEKTMQERKSRGKIKPRQE